VPLHPIGEARAGNLPAEAGAGKAGRIENAARKSAAMTLNRNVFVTFFLFEVQEQHDGNH